MDNIKIHFHLDDLSFFMPLILKWIPNKDIIDANMTNINQLNVIIDSSLSTIADNTGIIKRLNMTKNNDKLNTLYFWDNFLIKKKSKKIADRNSIISIA